MELKLFDLAMLLILAITVSLIIGMNVLYVVDKKMSDIKINVPACPVPKCPAPNVYIKTEDGRIQKIQTEMIVSSKSATDNKPKIIVDALKTKIANVDPKGYFVNLMNKRANNDDSIEKFDNVSVMNNGDKIYVDAPRGEEIIVRNGDVDVVSRNIKEIPEKPLVLMADKNKRKILLRQGYSSTVGLDKPNGVNNISDPRADDTLRFNGYGCYTNIDSRNVRKIKADEIENNNPTCMRSIVKDRRNDFKTQFMGPDGSVMNQDIKLYVPTVYMGHDPFIQGISYSNLSLEIPADVDQIGSIPVNDYDGEPVPIGSFIDTQMN